MAPTIATSATTAMPPTTDLSTTPVTFEGRDGNRRIFYGVNKTAMKQKTYFLTVSKQLGGKYKRAKGQAFGTVFLPEGLDVDVVKALITFAGASEAKGATVFTITAYNQLKPGSPVTPTVKKAVSFYQAACALELHKSLVRDLMRNNILTQCKNNLLSAAEVNHVMESLWRFDRGFALDVLESACQREKSKEYGTAEGQRQWKAICNFTAGKDWEDLASKMWQRVNS